MLNRYRERRTKAIVMLGGKCVGCGATKDLEFDHIDPKDKLFTIAKLWSCSEDIFLKEIYKCELKCKECHNKKHHTAKGTHGTLSAYRYCKCDLCREARNKYMREYKRKRRANKKANA